MKFNYFVHTDLTFGRNTISQLTQILAKYNPKVVMVVYDQGVKMAGLSDRILEILDKSAVKVVVYDQVLPNPSNELVESAAEIAKVQQVEVFIAIGGGSSIDLAKAVNIRMTNPLAIGAYGGIGNVENKVLPLIAIPTTAGTSSEITNVTALTDTVQVCKYVIIDNKIVPTDVIVDPDLTKTMPASVAAATGMDAITHAVESYISVMASPLTTYQSLEALRLLYTNLPVVLAEPDNLAAREQMMLGCVIAGFAFSNANLGLVHGIAHTLSAHFHLPHGMANAAVLPYVMAFNVPSCPNQMIEMAKCIGLPLTGDPEQDCNLFPQALKKMIKDLGIKTLSEQGVQEKDLTFLADEVLKEPVLNFNPRQNITKEQVLQIMKAAL